MEITLTQHFDLQAMNKLWNIKDTLDKTQVEYIDALYKKRKGGDQVKITYKHYNSKPGRLGFGRLNGSPGAAILFERNIRGALFSKYYHDIDMKNAHPTILRQKMESEGVPCPALADYVDNRDSVFAQLQADYNLDIEDSKTQFIKILYNSNPVSKYGKDCPPIMVAIYNEVLLYTHSLMKLPEYRELLQSIKGSIAAKPNEGKTVEGSFLSYILQTEERKIMIAMYEFLTRSGHSVDCLCYDGVMVRKQNTVFPEELLRATEQYVTEQTGWNIHLVVKPWECMDLSTVETPDAYQLMKAEFERSFCYFLTTNSICTMIKRGDESVLLHLTKDNVITSFGNIWKLDKDDPRSFLKKWFVDSQRRNVTNITLKPSDDPTTFSLFNGFAFQLYNGTEDLDIINITRSTYNELMAHVCNRNEEIKTYVLHWQAHMVQKPFENPGTCLIFSGRQGVGKDTLGNLLGNFILGKQYYADYEDVSMFWDRYDTKKQGKILIKLQEADLMVNKKYSSSLKARITSETITVNPKGVGSYTVDNYARYMMTTNEGVAVNLEEGDRRFVLIACGSYHAKDPVFWKRMYDILYNQRAGAIIGQMLMEEDISDWDPRTVPTTELKEIATEESRSSEDIYIRDVWDGSLIRATELYNRYVAYCQENSLYYARSAKGFGLKLLPFIRDGVISKKVDKIGSLYIKPETVANQVVYPPPESG